MLTPDVILGGLVIGLLLGLTGGGGSVLTVPLLIYGVGLETKSAIATSLVIVGFASMFALVQHHRAQQVRWKLGFTFGLFGMFGAYLGGRIAENISETILLVVFAIVMFLGGIAMLQNKVGNGNITESLVTARLTARTIIEGFTVGVVTGLVGIGGGFVIVPALILFGGLSVHLAVGTSLLVISMNCVAALAGYLNHVPVSWDSAIIIGCCAAVGTYLGSRLSQRLNAPSLQRILGFMVLLTSIAIASAEIEKIIPVFRL